MKLLKIKVEKQKKQLSLEKQLKEKDERINQGSPNQTIKSVVSGRLPSLRKGNSFVNNLRKKDQE
jgi:hypothetical protein